MRKGKINDYFLILWSRDPGKLSEFYINTLGLTPTKSLRLPDDYGFALVTESGTQIWIGRHSKIKGNNHEKFRFIINFYVEDVHAWYKKLTRRGVEIVAKPFVMPHTRKWPKEKRRHCVTFLDPDGNMLQMTTKK